MVRKYFLKRVTSIIVFALLFGIVPTNFQYGYADNKAQPDITLYIQGEDSEGGPMFHTSGDASANSLWAPGVTKNGTWRIYNNYSERIKVNNLSLVMNLEKLENGKYKKITDKELIETYAKSMKVTVKKGTILNFTNTIFDKSFFEMLYGKNNLEYDGYDLPTSDQFSIRSNKYVDLEYTVHMKEDAGNELQGIRANVSFIINSHENPKYDPPDSHNDSDDSDKETDSDESSNAEGLSEIDDSDSSDEPPDIQSHWAHDCIITLIDYDIIKGYPDGTIRPENYVTRQEVAALIGRALGVEEDNSKEPKYSDVIPGWVKGYVNTLTEMGIFKGYPLNQFKPDRNISREEMVAVLIRAFKLEDEKVFNLEFEDKDEIGQWALEYIRAGVQNNVVTGYPDNTFKPKESITRGELFTLLCKVLEYHEEHKQQEVSSS
ncbi:S-layer homology domain-containing protein [Sporosalibacterium faouarense]|uniref:S-layer homology domain-containing protein n=1 Tax=Sporosalibacterium faouarense TaxID=516123 RepID=UPI00192AB420